MTDYLLYRRELKTRSPPKKGKGIAPYSKKRKVDQKEYVKIVKEMLEENPLCEIKEEGCGIIASGLHHQKKRTPETLLDRRFLIRACTPCQNFCERFPLIAIERGYSISKYCRA